MRPIKRQSPFEITIARSLIATSLVLAVVGTMAFASADQTEVETAQEPAAAVVGQFGGTLRGLTVVGSRGYATIGARFVVLDLADPRQPNPVGKSEPLPDVANDIAVAGDHAFVALMSGGVAIVDIAEPRRPALVSRIPGELYQILLGVAVTGNLLIVISSENGFHVYDIEEPGRPTALGQLELGGPSHVQARGSYAFVTRTGARRGLDVIDLSDPEKPFVARTVDLADRPPFDLELDSDRLFVVSYRELTVFDVADPLLIHELGSTQITGEERLNEEYLRAVEVEGDRVTVAGSEGTSPDDIGRLWMVDAAAPDQMRVLGTLDLPRPLSDVATQNSFVLAMEFDGRLQVVDAADSAHPAHVASFVTPGPIHRLVFAGRYGYSAYFEDGMQVFDVAFPGEPRAVGLTLTDVPSYPVTASQEILYAWEALDQPLLGDGQYVLYDLRDPVNPTLIGRIDMGYSRLLAVSQGMAFFIDREDLLTIYDVRDPSQPVLIGSQRVRGAQNLVHVGAYAYVASGERGLRVFDVSDPEGIREVGVLAMPNHLVYWVHVDGTTAYLMGSSFSFAAVDVSDVERPRLLWMSTELGNMQGAKVFANGRLCISNAPDLFIYQVSSTEHPLPVAHLMIPADAHFGDIAERGDHIFVAAGQAGLIIIELPEAVTATPRAETAVATPVGTPTPRPAIVQTWLPALHR